MAMGSKEFKQHQAKLGKTEPKTMYEVYAFSLQIKPVRVVKETSKFVWIDVGMSGMGWGGDGSPRKVRKKDSVNAVCESWQEAKDWLVGVRRIAVAALEVAMRTAVRDLSDAQELEP